MIIIGKCWIFLRPRLDIGVFIRTDSDFSTSSMNALNMVQGADIKMRRAGSRGGCAAAGVAGAGAPEIEIR
jgi:hypothetical protein